MSKPYPITNQRELRKAFWELCGDFPGISRKQIANYSGSGKMHNTDTRCAFTDFVDSLSKNNQISTELAHRVTIS